MKKLSRWLVAIIAVPASMALAQDTDRKFASLDADSDGFVSVYEAEADMQVLNQFGQLDGDSDGRLSKEEFAAYQPE